MEEKYALLIFLTTGQNFCQVHLEANTDDISFFREKPDRIEIAYRGLCPNVSIKVDVAARDTRETEITYEFINEANCGILANLTIKKKR